MRTRDTKITEGSLKNDRNGRTAIVSKTPISGIVAINVNIIAANMKRMINKGLIKKVESPASRPKKSIRLPFPCEDAFLLSKLSSENPKVCLNIALPKTLFLIE